MFHPRLAALLALFGLLLWPCGCGWLRKPNLEQIYPETRRPEPVHPVILIPGFLGSKLKDRHTGRVTWGKLLDIFGSGRKDRFALPIDGPNLSANVDDLVAYGLYDNVAGARYYGEILDGLREHGGYRQGEITDPRPGENCFVFYYDWRRDMVESSRKLGEAIERIQTAFGDPTLKVDLVGHSMGGLIARYYVMYGKEDVLDRPGPIRPTHAGARNVDRVVLIGTPNEGSVNSLKVLNQGLKKVVKPVSVREVFTMPSLYQMLPAPGYRPIVDEDGNEVLLDIYDPETWERYEWSVFHPRVRSKKQRKDPRLFPRRAYRDFLGRVLDRAYRFYQALHPPKESWSGVEYFTFGSDCSPTLDKAVLRSRDQDGWDLHFQNPSSRYDVRWARLRDVLFRPGDGVVTRQSLLSLQQGDPDPGGPTQSATGIFPYAYFLCETHGLLTRDVIFQNNLFYILRHSRTRRTGFSSAGL